MIEQSKEPSPEGADVVATHDISSEKITAALNEALEWHRKGNLGLAQTAYKRVLALQPRHPEALNFLGILLQQRKQSTQAEQSIRKAIHCAPHYAAAYTNLGNVLLVQRRHEEAIAAYQQAIRLRVDEVDACVNLGAILRGMGRQEEALAAYQQASQRKPGDPGIHFRLATLLAEQGHSEQAIETLWITLRHNPTHEDAIKLMGNLLHAAGRKEEARELIGKTVFQLGGTEKALSLLQHWLHLMPDDPIAQHRLSAWFGGDTPERASNAYVTDLFDRYADSFDSHLQELGYQAPTVLAEYLAENLDAPTGEWHVLDAGCGTGLCQAFLRPYAQNLVGVDLSSRMLDKARERGGYDQLVAAELTAFLNTKYDCYDLILSADTLVYFGNLTDVINAAAHALHAGGWLAFTAEKASTDSAPSDGFHLDRSGRYSHTADYLVQTLLAAGMTTPSIVETTLRQEGDEPVTGYVALAQKPVAEPPAN
ncbi:MAG: hypothetical protein CSA09_03570 [Candidatus Contendobacter odensis]|uniref:Methyltransferase type 11 domain-containing protein n=1 Tax=Candidatus Contendibacter odensensis TaxID=1400860 RepID=A0A2G6PF28_9GAMM|nr:MAG: hypothetical protein CSA09_03570 [Candidatus Contendobacter odensis]